MPKFPDRSSAFSRRRFLRQGGVALAGLTAANPTLAATASQPGPVPGPHGSAPERSAGRKVFALVVGSLRFPVIERLAAAGRMPVMKKLMQEGAVSSELLNLCANKSHAAVINAVTGATTGTHRAITILRSETGRPPLRQDLLGKICQAEFLWDAAERQGKRVIVLNFPDSWPPKLKRGILIGGASLNVNATLYEGVFDREMGYPTFQYALAADEGFSTSSATGWSEMKLVPLASSGANPAGVSQGLAARLPLRCATPDREILQKPVLWLIVNPVDQTAGIYEDGKWATPLGTVAVGHWSQRLNLVVRTAAGPVPVAVKIKLLELDADKASARLYVSPLGPIHDGRTFPAEGVPELAALKSFPVAASVVMNRAAGLLDPASQRELLAMSGDWYLDALGVLLRKPWDLFVFHTNDLDWAEHANLKHHRNGLPREQCEAFIDRLYEDLDQQIGRIVKQLPPDTTFLMMSPHGIICPWDIKGSKSVNDVLGEAGLLNKNQAGEIDYDRSQAYSAPEGEGFVNVSPWRPTTPAQVAEREKNLRRACQVLSAATDRATGERTFTVVLPWEDAAPFGLHGQRQADIVTMKPAVYGGIHGPCYPLTATGESTLKGLCVFWGPGIRARARENRPVYPEDFAPTAAHLLGIDPPRDSEGKVIYRMLGLPAAGKS